MKDYVCISKQTEVTLSEQLRARVPVKKYFSRAKRLGENQGRAPRQTEGHRRKPRSSPAAPNCPGRSERVNKPHQIMICKNLTQHALNTAAPRRTCKCARATTRVSVKITKHESQVEHNWCKNGERTLQSTATVLKHVKTGNIGSFRHGRGAICREKKAEK